MEYYFIKFLLLNLTEENMCNYRVLNVTFIYHGNFILIFLILPSIVSVTTVKMVTFIEGLKREIKQSVKRYHFLLKKKALELITLTQKFFFFVFLARARV